MIQSTLLPLALLASQVAAQSLGSPGLHDLKTILLNSELSWSPEALVTFPDDEEDSAFINATERWSIMGAPTYLAAVTPANEEDVVLAVSIALPVNFVDPAYTRRSNSHASTTSSSWLPVVVTDMSPPTASSSRVLPLT